MENLTQIIEKTRTFETLKIYLSNCEVSSVIKVLLRLLLG